MTERVRIEGWVPRGLAMEVRDAVAHLRNAPIGLSISGLIERGVRRELRILRAQYNDGRGWVAPKKRSLAGKARAA